jgi:excinuclease UvrABC nuclease subunit
LLRAGQRRLYVGDALNLRERFKSQFERTKYDFEGVPRDTLELSYRAVEEVMAEIVAPNQSIRIGKWKPEWNLSSLAQAS